jgi:hypothetical protein
LALSSAWLANGRCSVKTVQFHLFGTKISLQMTLNE